MARTKYSDESGEQIVRETLEKDRIIVSVAAFFRSGSADRGGPGSTRCRKEHAEQDPEDAAESAEIAGLRAEKRGLRTEMRVA